MLGTCLLFLFSKLIAFNGLYGQDSYEYVRYSIALKQYLSNGDGIAPNDFFWPPLYPLAGALLSFVFPLILSLQLVSIVSFGGVLLYIHKIISLLYGEKRRDILFLIVFGFLSPYFLRLSLCVMSDMLAMFFCVASVFYALNYYVHSKSKDFIFSLCLFMLSVFTRYSSFMVLFLPVLLLVKHFVSNFRISILMLSLAAIVIILIVVYFIQPDFYTPFRHPLLMRWSFSNYFLSEFNYEDGLLSYKFINILFVLFVFIHPGFIAIGILLLFFAFKMRWNKTAMCFIMLPLLIYILFLAGTPNQNTRLLSFVYPFVLILFYKPFEFLYEKYISSLFTGIIVFTALGSIQIILIFMSFKPLRQLSFSDKVISQKIIAVQENHTIYTCGMDGALRTYGVKNKIVDLWNKKVDTLSLPSIVLIDEKQITEKSKGKFTYQNWQYILANYKLYSLYKQDNWQIYAIEKE